MTAPTSSSFGRWYTSGDATTYRLDAVWPTPARNDREDVIAFWLAESALPNLKTAKKRARELLVVARDSQGHVAGVSTAVRTLVQQLGFECFFYRTFIGRAHRAHGLRSTQLFWKILLASHSILNQRFLAGCDPKALGIYAEIENASITKRLGDAVWQKRAMNVVYIGRTLDGRHQRVWYFDGARIP